MENNYLKNIFVLLVLSDKEDRYEVHLVNQSESVMYSRVEILSGAFEGDIDGLVETNKVEKVYGALYPKSSILLEADTLNWLDMTIWYHLDIYLGIEKLEKVWFQFRYPRNYDTQKEEIPYLGKTGLKIELMKV
ncbi:MAG: hypothetical protein Q7S10_01855 [bacterium]|nr:hypothetical protein [bacterium]